MGEHWYSRDGAPAYEVIAKSSGLPRPTTLSDARRMGLVPSVTTVLSILSKPALEAWKVRQGILAALTLTRESEEADDAFLARVMADSQQQAKDAAAEGTRIHDAIEAHFKGEWFPPQYEPHVEGALRELERLFPGVDDWIAERSFASPYGYGGKVDLHSPSTGITVDHKGKDGDFSDGKRLAYDQNYQLAPYQRGLRLPLAPCANLFVSRTHPGAVKGHVWTEKHVSAGWDVFDAALELWKRVRKFDSSFETERKAA